MRVMNRIRHQAGVSITGFLLFGGLVAVLAVEAARTYPIVLEYYEIQSAVTAAASANSPAEARRTFDRFAAINNITSVGSENLEIDKDKTGLVVSVSYNAWANLFRNVNLVIQFNASSRPLLTDS